MELRVASARGRWTLAATVLGSSVAWLDATIVNIALPTIGRELDASIAGLQWIITGYTLTLAALILLGGSLGDRYGRRRVFLIGVVWFASASLLCAVAPTIAFLIVARMLQGVGGALLTPGSLALIQASFHPDDRGRAVGAWSGLGGVAAALGPFLGGWLIAGPGWRWAFLINLPVAAAVVLVTLRHVPESRDEQATGSFDVAGAVLGSTALATLTFALIRAGGGWGWTATAVGAVGVATSVAFVLVERGRSTPRGRPPRREAAVRTKPTPAAMVPLDVFSSRQSTAVNIVTFVVYAALGGISFVLMLQLQVVAGYPPLAAGAALLPMTVLMLLLSSRAGALAQRIGPRWPMTVGTAIAAVGVLLLSRIGPDSSYVGAVLPAAAVYGLGMSFTVAPLTATVLATAEVRHAGVASGVNNAVARAASLLAVAALPALVGLTGAEYENPTALSAGFRAAMWLCAGGLALGSLLSLTTIRDDALRPTAAHPVVVRPERDFHCAIDATPLEGGARP